MKKQLLPLSLIIPVLFLCLPQLSAQRMVEVDNRWNVVTYPTFSPETRSYSVKIGTDTMLNSQLYQKVLYSDDSLDVNWAFRDTYLREDNDQKVYYKKGGLDEIVLYDFSLALNDTFTRVDLCDFEVVAIDSVELNNGEKRKRLKLEQTGLYSYPIEHYWIEGVGSNYGVISHPFTCYTDYADAFLCFYSESELLYPESPSSCFITITGVEELRTDASIKVYPNPAETTLYVEDQNLSLSSYTIYDLIGKQIQSGDFSGFNNAIELKDFQSGYYTLILKNKEGSYFSQKLIKK